MARRKVPSKVITMPGTLASSLLAPTLAFAWPGWLIGITITLFLFVCVVLVLTVLIQKPQGGGLASAFGGGASAGQTAFGTKTGDALTVVTISVFVLYLLLAITLNFAARPQVIVKGQPAAESPAAPDKPEAPADGTAPATKPEGQPATTPATPENKPAETPAAPATNAPATPAPTPAPTQPAAPK